MREVLAWKRLKTMENTNNQTQKVVMVAYRRWSFTKGSNWKALTGKMFGWEVVTHGTLTVMY